MSARRQYVTEPKQFVGSRQLLFDRLVDQSPTDMMESAGAIYLDKQGVIDSVIVEVERLLNTRIAAKRSEYEDFSGIDKTVIAYGLPSLYGMTDFGSVDGSNKQDWLTIAQVCTAAIEHFEPRIKNVRIIVDHFDGNSQKLFVNIDAELALKNIQGEVSFPVAIDCGERDQNAT